MNVRSIRNRAITLLGNKEFILLLGVSLLVLIIFLINGKHEKYPDEFDNILGGRYLLEGKLIYRDWFTHHGPFPYFLSAAINIFSNNSFVNFRFIYSIFLFGLTILSYLFIKRRLKSINITFYLFFIFLIGIGATYFWGHMLLADSLSGFLLTPVFALIILKIINNKKFELIDFTFISLFSFLTVISSLSYLFLIAGIYTVLLFYYILQEKRRFNLLEFIKIITVFVIPYIFFLIYLIITGSFSDYIYQAFIFNKDYYIYYPGLEGKPPSNPLRYAIVILNGFHNNFSSMMITVRDFNFSFPFNITLGVVNTVFGIYLLFKRKYLALLFLIGVLVYSNVRSNPFSSRETDYQSAVYIMISLFNMTYIIPTLYKELNSNIEYAKKLIFSLLFIVLIIYSFFSFTFLLRKFSYKAYDKYMGFAPRIYDRPLIAPLINQIVPNGKYAWIGPFYFDELYYLNAKIPSKYHILLPGMGKSDKIPPEITAEFEKNKPDVIYFNKDHYILGANPAEYGKFFMEFLAKNYLLLKDINGGIYSYSASVDPSIIAEQKLYIKKDKIPEIIIKMQENNLITKN